MRKHILSALLILASFTAHANPSAAQKMEREARFATLAVLSYGGFIAQVQRNCLPAKPAPTLVKDWQTRHKRILDQVDAFAEDMFQQAAKEGAREASEIELAYVVSQASSQLYRVRVAGRNVHVACPDLLARVKAGEFDDGEGRLMRPAVATLAQWSANQKKGGLK